MQFENLEIVEDLPPKPPRREPTERKKAHYKVVHATAKALAVAKASLTSAGYVRLARYATAQDARRAAHKLRTSRVWGGIGTIETAYRPEVEGNLDGAWILFARYKDLKLSEYDIDQNLARDPEDAAEALYGGPVDGDEINIVTGVSLQVHDPESELD